VEPTGAEAEAVDGGHEGAAAGPTRHWAATSADARRPFSAPWRVRWRARAASTLARTGAVGSASAASVSSSAVSRSAWTYRSMRSSSGPDRRLA
jgi:hypothetical protein